MTVSAEGYVPVAGAHRISMACQWVELEKLFATLVLHARTLWVHVARMWGGMKKGLHRLQSF